MVVLDCYKVGCWTGSGLASPVGRKVLDQSDVIFGRFVEL